MQSKEPVGATRRAFLTGRAADRVPAHDDRHDDAGAMNILGVLVHARPESADDVAAKLAAMAGVEVHVQQSDGRMVVTVEDCADATAGDTLIALHAVPGLISASLVYHHCDDPSQSIETIEAMAKETEA